MNKGLRSAWVGALATVAITAWSGGAHALQIVQTIEDIEASASSETFLNATTSRSAARFDPSLGTLDSVTFHFFDGFATYDGFVYFRPGTPPGTPVDGSVSLTNRVFEFSVPGYGTWSQSFGDQAGPCDVIGGSACFAGGAFLFDIATPVLTGDMLADYVGPGSFPIDFALHLTSEFSSENVPLSIQGASLNWSGTFKVTYTYTPVTYTPVPEPTTLALFGVGVVGLAGAMRRRRPR